MKKIMVLIMTLVFCVSGFSLVTAADTKQPLPQGSIVLQKETADVTGDGVKDYIQLLGQKFDNTSPYMKSIYLLVNETLIKFPKDSDGGYDPKFVLKDFNGDKIPDIFVSSETGGSGGIMYYHIYSLKGGKVKLLFSPTPDSALNITGSFQDNYKVNLLIQQTNTTYTLDFSSRKSEYEDPQLNLYKNGKLLRKGVVSTDYYGLLTPIDVDKDGVYEIQGIQAVWGIVHVDTLAQVTSTWKWVKDKWKVIKVDVSQVGDTLKSITSDQDLQKTMLSNIMALAKKGKIINCEFPVKTTVIEDVEKKWGQPNKTEWIPAAKGTYTTFSKQNIVFGFNKGSQIFEARSFDGTLGKINLSTVKEVFGKPAYDVKSGGQEIIGYTAGSDYKILLVFPQPTKSIANPYMDHYSVLYAKGTVNMMADDPGRQW